MEIKTKDLTIKNLLEQGFYKIPRFQRPYSWDRENVDEFWNDVVVSDDSDYFIGSFVLYRDKSDPDLYFIVDGQQRLTTITVLLAAVRDALHELGQTPLASGVQKLIEREDINSLLRFVLDSETPYPFLQEQIQKYGAKEKPGLLGVEERALIAAYVFLSTQVSKAIEAVDTDTMLAEKKKPGKMKKKLLSIRDRILSLQLILVELSNDDDAYLIFETLNTRGKDLTVSDLIKNHLARLLKPTHKGVDIAKDKYNSILDLFDKSVSDINVNRFLHHFWLSRNVYTTEKKLFKEVKRTVNKSTAMQFLDDLVDDSRLYRMILDPDWHKWKKDEREIADAIRAMNSFRVAQPLPMLLAIMRAYFGRKLTQKLTKKVLRAMENFHVQFTALTSQRTGGGTARMYAAPARLLLEADSKDHRSKVINEFISKLRDRVPSYEEFEVAFKEIWFTNESTKQRHVVRYLLQRIDKYSRKGNLPDYDHMTIEHLAPQSPSSESSELENKIGLMGNLLLVSGKLNNELSNKSFSKKKAILIESDMPQDPILIKATKWDDDAVDNRTKSMANMCYYEVFKV